MNQSRTDTLEVPGATLHYEVCGTGPVLLLIPGGPADAGAFASIRGELSDRYTVVTYDPRGLSRSPLDGDPRDTTARTFADDAQELLAAMGKFLASAGLDGEPPRPAAGPNPEMAEAMARMQGNFDLFLGHMWLSLADYARESIERKVQPLAT